MVFVGLGVGFSGGMAETLNLAVAGILKHSHLTGFIHYHTPLIIIKNNDNNIFLKRFSYTFFLLLVLIS